MRPARRPVAALGYVLAHTAHVQGIYTVLGPCCRSPDGRAASGYNAGRGFGFLAHPKSVMPSARRLSTVEVTPASGRPADEKATMDVGPVELLVDRARDWICHDVCIGR